MGPGRGEGGKEGGGERGGGWYSRVTASWLSLDQLPLTFKHIQLSLAEHYVTCFTSVDTLTAEAILELMKRQHANAHVLALSPTANMDIKYCADHARLQQNRE